MSGHSGGERRHHDLRSTLTRQRIQESARQIFLLNGFSGVGLDEIAAQAGVSKRTLQHHFGSKDALLGSLIDVEAERVARALPSIDPDESDTCSALRQIGLAVLETLNHPTTVATLRLVIGLLGRFPRLGEEFLRLSLGPTMEDIAAYLDRSPAAGGVRIDDSRAAAEEFARQCLAHVIERLLVPDQAFLTEAERAAVVEDILRNCGIRWRRAGLRDGGHGPDDRQA